MVSRRGYSRAKGALDELGTVGYTDLIRWTPALDPPSYFELIDDGRGGRKDVGDLFPKDVGGVTRPVYLLV